MLNRPTNIFTSDSFAGRPSDRTWRVDESPEMRLVWLLLLIVTPLLAVIGRLAYLQCVLGDRFVAVGEQTTESYEPIPSRDGRIFASDGRILAYDVEHFSVLMHYRWLEEPPDANWLTQRALSRLSREDRRDRELVERQRQKILAIRTQMWHDLAALAGTTPENLAERRRAIQSRVERIVAAVEENRRQRAAEREAARRRPDVPAGTPGWKRAWNRFRRALTTTPERHSDDPLIVKEELDYHVVIDDVDLAQAAAVEAHPERFPGLRIEVVTERNYPEKSLAAHVIGSRTRISDAELDRRKQRFSERDPLDYRRGDRIGKTGVERAYDRHLRGLRGIRRVIKNRRGEIIRTEVVRQPRLGCDLELTLHIGLQQRAEQLLDDVVEGVGAAAEETANREEPNSRPPGGCLVALDVHTGAVLAAASAPRFDLNLLTDPDPDVWQQVMADPRRPFFPRMTRMTLAPGSVFKTLTAVALLEDGQIDPRAMMHCRGYLDQPNRHRCYIFTHYGIGHHDVNLSDALCQSCNVYFFHAARQMGPEPLCEWAERFGFGQPTGIDLPGERGGNLPSPSPPGTPSEERTTWYPGDTLGLAIGQSRLTVTPLQIVRLMAAIANGGNLVTPYVVRDIRGVVNAVPDGASAWPPDGPGAALATSEMLRPPRPIPGLSASTLAHLREGLERVVSDRKGTAYKTVRLDDVAIAGKTGTAEVGGGLPDHAWFAGYVPAEAPQIAFVVVLEHAGSGGRAAGPVAQDLVRAMLNLGMLPGKGRASQLAVRN